MSNIHLKIPNPPSSEISIRGETGAVRKLLEHSNVRRIGIEMPKQSPLEARFGVGIIAQSLNQLSTEGTGTTVPVERKYLKQIAEKLETAADSI